ncbi:MULTISPECIES: thioesterase II family protein [Pseudomonas]|uniref:Surfactin synthase thioesterase subunit n=2 Tax=Pseudomonas fluorescens group TaxID=136843 RepID=A0ABY0V8B2_9PSED|nr:MULTISPECIES: alpha/beta fold hydrolase [Pseudomonas]MDF9882080.1 surfactin synthase thioesterase subunit [Pseudomonas silensiensis]TWC18711.1 surfactin synthase thioesterase subunit [Pseudomonas sp. SJZ083]TWC45967.1 surfactin synthase thioesterase subunit [Pseudomonas sp. SJZ077]TWS08318.1 thioesterase [Pseudomonas mandelii]SDT97631.1 Surfactin synthase thioesterase subunit [Pseudomonas mandelii]
MTQLTLLCLPYSGASAMVYSRWRRKLPEWLTLQPVELPGRGARYGEPLHTDMRRLALQLAQEQKATLKAPYALFGHSLGALLACEMAHAFRSLGCPEPVALFASGTAAPTMRADYDRGFAQPRTDAELIDQLRTLNGTSEEVLANKELMSLTLPVLRADFLLCGRFEPQQRPLLKCPVHVLGGKDDRATTEQLIGWSKETHGSFSVDMLAGGHFFIHEHEAKVLRVIKDQLEVHHRRHAMAASA